MLKALKNCLLALSSIVLLSSSVYAMSSDDFLHLHEDRIQKMCEDRTQEVFGDGLSGMNNPFRSFFKLSGKFECGLTQFHALHKVIDLLLTIDRSSEDWKVFAKIMDENIIDDYETFDFMNIHLEYLAYLEEKSG